MSWTQSYPSRDAFFADEPAQYSTRAREDEPHVQDQIEVARAAATQILESGALGDTDCSITLAGHANPDHAPSPGMSAETMSITISCKS